MNLLKWFIEREGEIISRDELLNQVWGYDSFPDTRTIDTHIAKLRHKIEDNPEEPKLIVTIHGIGLQIPLRDIFIDVLRSFTSDNNYSQLLQYLSGEFNS